MLTLETGSYFRNVAELQQSQRSPVFRGPPARATSWAKRPNRNEAVLVGPGRVAYLDI